MNQIEMALDLALKAHKGQIDLDGNPIILHPLTVGLAGQNDDERVLGFLHDVVEDTDYTFDDLRQMGFASNIVEALQLLTHGNDMSYEEYVSCIVDSGNELAIHVKLNDLHHNISRGLAGGHTKLVEKHLMALDMFKRHGLTRE